MALAESVGPRGRGLRRRLRGVAGALGLVVGVVALLGASAAPAQAACAPGFAEVGTACQARLGFTGSPAKLEVPGGVELTMRALGASGGGNAIGFCGTGGYDSGELAVGSPESLTVEVGGSGEAPEAEPAGGAGGYGGGGRGGSGGPAAGGGGGGGGTFILAPSGKPLLVAGGGGGGGSEFHGGWGGVVGFPGGEPLDPPACAQIETEVGVFKQAPEGQPGQPAAGGAGGSTAAGAGKGPAVGVGVFGEGGEGAESSEGGGGGGGGGYYGGGGGGGGGWEIDSEDTGGGAGGGGGNGFISPCLTNHFASSPQEALDNGYAELLYTPGAPTAAPTASACQLKVFVKIVGPIANVGTRSGLAFDEPNSKDGPVRFTALTASNTETEYAEANEAGQRCESGCANLLVTVIDPQTGRPLVNATVNADLGGIDTAGFPNLNQVGEQFLCVQSDDPTPASCGTELHGMKTNANGRIHLLYWAPGELVPGHAILTVSAANCAFPCPAGSEEGSEVSKLTVEPYRIYDHRHGELSREEVKALIDAVDEHKGLEMLLSAAHHKVLESALEWLGEHELLSEHLVKAAAGPLGYAIVGAGELAKIAAEGFKGIKEQKALAAALLESLDLSPEGIGIDPFEHNVPAGISHSLQHLILNDLGLPTAGGLLWDLGKQLSEQYKAHRALAVQPEHVGVSVYEMSTCAFGHFNCGPGFDASLTGILPRLCFDFSFSNGAGGDFDTVRCIHAYSPVVWAPTQKGLDRAQP